jgi:hypothetical protein
MNSHFRLSPLRFFPLTSLVILFECLFQTACVATYRLILLWSFTPRYIRFGAGGSLVGIRAFSDTTHIFYIAGAIW